MHGGGERPILGGVMVNPRLFLKAALQLHGHGCPELALGLRAGAAAMNQLGVERSRAGELMAIVELPEGCRGQCFADGVQVVTGCTLGKANVRIIARDALSLTLVDQATRRAVRVGSKVEVPPGRTVHEEADPFMRRLLAAPEEEIVSVGEEFRPEAQAGGIDRELTPVNADQKDQAIGSNHETRKKTIDD